MRRCNKTWAKVQQQIFLFEFNEKLKQDKHGFAQFLGHTLNLG